MVDMNGDGIDDSLQRAGQAMLSAAMHIGRAIALAREAAQRRALERTQEVQRQLAARFSAERALAHVTLKGVANMSTAELDQMPLQDLAKCAELATAWRDVDKYAHEAYPRLRDHVQERFGFDPEHTLGTTERAMDLSVKAVRDYAASEQAAAVAEESEAARLDHESRAATATERSEAMRTYADKLQAGIDPDKTLGDYTEAERDRAQSAQQWSRAAEATERDGKVDAFMANAMEKRAMAARMSADRLKEAGLTADQVRGVLASDRAFGTSATEAIAPRGRAANVTAAEPARRAQRDLSRGR